MNSSRWAISSYILRERMVYNCFIIYIDKHGIFGVAGCQTTP